MVHDYTRYHPSKDMAGVGELADVSMPAAVVIRAGGSVDAYGPVTVIDQRATVPSHPDWSLMSPDPSEELRRHAEFDHGTVINDHAHDDGHAHLPPLDRECRPCKADPGPLCVYCHGTGWIITDAGRQVIAFLQRHPVSRGRDGNRDEADLIELGFRAANGFASENHQDSAHARQSIVYRGEIAAWRVEDEQAREGS